MLYETFDPTIVQSAQPILRLSYFGMAVGIALVVISIIAIDDKRKN